MSLRSLLWVVSLSGCGVHHAPAPWVTDLRVEGPHASGRGLTYDPDLATLEGESPAWIARELAWTSREQATDHLWVRWWHLLPFSAWVQPLASLDDAILDEDRQRLEDWWVDQGWLDASVIVEVKPSDRKCPSLGGDPCGQDVVFRVTQGPRVTVRATLEGVEPNAPKGLATLDALLPPEGGAERARLAYHRDLMQTRLEGLGYAAATVDWRIDRAGEEGTVVYSIDPGPRLTYGDIQVQGPSDRPARAIQRSIERAAPEGARWNGDALRKTGDPIANLPGVAGVSFEPGLPEDGKTPVLIGLELEPPHSLSPLVIAGAQGATLSGAVGFDWLHHGRVGRWVTSHVRALAGARAIPVEDLTEDWLRGNLGPTLDVQASTRMPVFPSGRAVVQIAGDTLRDVRRGYQSMEHRLSAGVGWDTDQLQINASGVFDLRTYGHSPGQREVHDRWFGPGQDLDEHTRWVYPSTSLTFHTLDRDVDPKSGVRLQGTLAPWIPEGERTYRHATARLRGYQSLGSPRWTLAAHGALGLTRSDDGGPIRGLGLRHFLGGTDDLRGFTWRNVASPGNMHTDPWEVRVGGDTMAFGSLTARYRIHPDMTLGPFIEAGRVWELQTQKRPPSWSDLLSDVGLEVQAASPLGWVRGDVSWLPAAVEDVGTPPPRFMWQLTIGQLY